jgi:hypothetical protein
LTHSLLRFRYSDGTEFAVWFGVTRIEHLISLGLEILHFLSMPTGGIILHLITADADVAL